MSALTVMAAGVVAGEIGKVVIGLMVSDPQVTVPVIKYAVPGAVAYDLLLCPFALWLTSLLSGRPQPARDRELAPVIQPQLRPKLLSGPQSAGVFRLASEGGVPRLRLADTRARFPFVPARREPRLHLASGRSTLTSRTSGGSSLTSWTSVGGRPAKVNFSSPGPVPNSAPFRQDSSKMAKPGKGWLRSAKSAEVGWRPRSPGSGWLRGGQRSKRDGWLNRGARYRAGTVGKYQYRRGRE